MYSKIFSSDSTELSVTCETQSPTAAAHDVASRLSTAGSRDAIRVHHARMLSGNLRRK